MENNLVAKSQNTQRGRLLTGRVRIGLACAALCMVSAIAVGQVFEHREFQNPEQERRYREIISELRCLVCQNQNLADSNAPLAADLRDIVYDMLRKGKSEDEIHRFMVDRYGDFVLYRPPFTPKTVLLWAGPFVLLALGLLFLLRQIRKRSTAASGARTLDEAEREQLNAMLGSGSGALENRRED